MRLNAKHNILDVNTARIGKVQVCALTQNKQNELDKWNWVSFPLYEPQLSQPQATCFMKKTFELILGLVYVTLLPNIFAAIFLQTCISCPLTFSRQGCSRVTARQWVEQRSPPSSTTQQQQLHPIRYTATTTRHSVPPQNNNHTPPGGVRGPRPQGRGCVLPPPLPPADSPWLPGN